MILSREDREHSLMFARRVVQAAATRLLIASGLYHVTHVEQ